MNELKERFIAIRKKEDINQGEFAERIGLKQGSLSEIENGKEPLSERIKKLICLEFGINEDWLLTGKGEMLQPREISPEGKQLLKVFDKLEPEGKKEVKKYADERLELQVIAKDQEKAWKAGLEGKTLKVIEVNEECPI
jgi:transcriptional regulator with XRE-family HTH domain